MGVHGLWSIVEPVHESVPLYSLSGKTLAVDLSLWVCEAQHVHAMMGRVTKPHLRNLFFRVSSLTLMGVKLVFVMEGEAPRLKAETMSKRTDARFGGVKKTSAPKSSSNTSRGRFNAVLRECADMLDYLGVPWVTAAGEAEAMCAALDSQGLVDGCITNDGDAFLYGARTVYRNFNMNTKDPQVDCYRTSRVQTELLLSRENLVGLAILLGCDYIPKGVPGVGKEQAVKLIQTLKGQTLLQRFIQWKEDKTCVSEAVVKKVPHCLVCRHPGSAKAHERGGCVLCDSKRFCQPQDFDYQCPCDWHHYEQTCQAFSLETNIRKKTLASQQFPFTEIIREFLISKDKPVSHFKRRQPNLLLMQKFAYDKMEWAKHYTSEKVLVLMTYTELMNRKCGQAPKSSRSEHYTFPEDRPAEEQQEVRTVEEEALFRAAFPEVVQSYVRDQALAEENKTKKKKPKSKKEKPADLSDGISDLLAQMSLQSSSTQPQELLPTISKTEKAEMVDLCSPVNHPQNGKDDHIGVGNPPDTPLSHPESEAVASLSVSSVIDALHLSDIDWEAPSFTSSPPPQVAKNHTAGPRIHKSTDEVFEETEVACNKQETSSDVIQTDSRSAPELCSTECSLRDRVLMRNAAKAMNQQVHDDAVLKTLNLDSTNTKTKPDLQISSKGGGDREGSDKGCEVRDTEPLRNKSQCVGKKTERETCALNPAEQDQRKAKDKRYRPQKPPQKYKFVKSALPASSAPPQRLHSDPGPRGKDRDVPQTTKKSVCLSVCSSSEDSDTENRQCGPLSKPRMKPISKRTDRDITGVSLKPLSGPIAAKQRVKPAQGQHPPGPKSQRQTAGVQIHTTPVSMNSKVKDVAVDGDVLPVSPASPVTAPDDSVICSDSPLPLAERLRLKFLK